MRIVYVLLACICLAASPGCTNLVQPTAPRAKAFLALKDVWTLKDRAMRVYAEKAVLHKITIEQRAKVWEQHRKFQAGYDAALTLVSYDTNGTAPDDLVNLTQTLVDLINAL